MRPVDPVKSKKIIVLGGGLSGLSAAWCALSKLRDCKVTVIEKNGFIGGLAASFRWNGFTLDFGPHRFHTKNAETLEIVRRLVGGQRLLHRDRLSHIYLNEKYIEYPLKLDAIACLDPLTIGHVLFDFAAAKIVSPFRGKSDDFEGHVKKKFGKKLYDIYFGPYTEKLWGVHPGGLSADWAEDRISGLSMYQIAKKMLNIGGGVRTFTSKFWYPKGGIGEISKRLGEEIKTSGGMILTGKRVQKISRSHGKFFVEADGRVFAADSVISTIPITTLSKIIRPKAPRHVVKAANALRFRSMVFVFVLLDQEHAMMLPSDNWIYYYSKDVLFHRLSQQKSFSPTTCPAGKSEITAEIVCFENDRVWNTPDHEIKEKVLSDLKKVGMLSAAGRKRIIGVKVVRVPYVYPIYAPPGYKKHLDSLEEFVKSAGIVSAGRGGLFQYNNLDSAIESGIAAGNQLSVLINGLRPF